MQRARQVAGIDGHDFPIARHRGFVTGPGEVGAFQGLFAEVAERAAQSVSRRLRE